MMQPKRTKFRKQFKGGLAGLAQRGSTVAFGEFGLKAVSRARMTARELEAARRAMTRYVKRGVRCGFAYSQMCQLPKSPSKFEWVAVKVAWSTTWPRCCLERFCLRWKVYQKRSLAKHFDWLHPSCLLIPNL